MREQPCPYCGWGTIGMALWWVLAAAVVGALLWILVQYWRRR
jgi:hypothetical protein